VEHEQEEFYACVASQNDGKLSKNFFFDFGASKHMLNKSVWFVEFMEKKTSLE
jgi:hypothetical protein